MYIHVSYTCLTLLFIYILRLHIALIMQEDKSSCCNSISVLLVLLTIRNPLHLSKLYYVVYIHNIII